MDDNNWRPNQGLPSMEASNWRTQVPLEARPRIVRMIMETLKKHIPSSEETALSDYKNIAIRLEETIYTAATSQADYLRKISVKLLTVESNNVSAWPSNSSCNDEKPRDIASQSIRLHVHEQGQSLTVPLGSECKALQKLLSQNIQNNNVSIRLQCSSNLPSTINPVTGLTHSLMPYGVGQNANTPNISGSSQSSVGNSEGQQVSSNIRTDSQKLVQGRQTLQQVVSQQQQVQHQLLEQKFEKGKSTESTLAK